MLRFLHTALHIDCYLLES